MRGSSARSYLLAYAALVLLSCATLSLSFLPLGGLGVPLALGIAAIKAVVIAVFFMHLSEQRAVNTLFLVISLILIAFFVTLSALDVGTRSDAARAGHVGCSPMGDTRSFHGGKSCISADRPLSKLDLGERSRRASDSALPARWSGSAA